MRTLMTLLTCALLLSSSAIQARIWRVNYHGYGANYTGANALVDAINAVDSVRTGDTLHVEPTTNAYTGFVLNRRLVILGSGYFLNENIVPPLQASTQHGWIASITIPSGASGSTISGVYIGQVILCGSVAIDRCRINDIKIPQSIPAFGDVSITRCFVNTALWHDNYGGYSIPTILNLLVSNCYFGTGFDLAPNHSGRISHCVMNGNIDVHGILFDHNIVRAGITNQNTNSNASMTHNIFHNNPGSWMDGGTNHRNQAVETFFPATGSTDGKLNTTGLCSLCAAESIGIIYGNTPYIPSGIPAIPSIYGLTVPATAIQGAPLPVTIGTRSND